MSSDYTTEFTYEVSGLSCDFEIFFSSGGEVDKAFLTGLYLIGESTKSRYGEEIEPVEFPLDEDETLKAEINQHVTGAWQQLLQEQEDQKHELEYEETV